MSRLTGFLIQPIQSGKGSGIIFQGDYDAEVPALVHLSMSDNCGAAANVAQLLGVVTARPCSPGGTLCFPESIRANGLSKSGGLSYIFKSSHLHTSSHIFTSSHPHIFTFLHLLILSLSLSLFFFLFVSLSPCFSSSFSLSLVKSNIDNVACGKRLQFACENGRT